MATGFEAAGLVLGLFPILIEGVTMYMSSIEKAKGMIRHRRTLKRFKRDLEMEKSVFDNIWIILLDRAGISGEPDIDPSPEITEAVLSCLPACTVKSFLNGCQELITMLNEMNEKLQNYEQEVVGMTTCNQGFITNYQLIRQAIASSLQCFNILNRKIEMSALSAFTG